MKTHQNTLEGEFKTKFILVAAAMLFIILLLPFVSSEIQNLGTFQQYTNVELIQICSSCSYNNISAVLYPDSTQALGQVAMTRIGTKYNYTIDAGTINQLGTYIVNGFGDLDGASTVWSYTFEVTTTGQKQTSILENPMIIILSIVGILLIIFGISLGFSWMGFIGSIMFILAGIYTMIYGFNNTTNFYTQGIALVIIGIGAVFLIISSYDWIYSSGGNDNSDDGEEED